MTLFETQVAFNRATMALEAQFIAGGVQFVRNECKRSNEQAAINALGYDGREALVAAIADDPRFHALIFAIRDNGKANGILYSVHCDGLAVDYNLFRDGKYLSATEDHQQFGEWWEKQHELARWGGRFRDGNHYSFEYGGRR